MWINDSGSAAQIIATNLRGDITRTVELLNFPNKDFEALSLGHCPDFPEKSCLFLADIGDNRRRRNDYKIGVFREEEFWTKESISPLQITEFHYPSGSENAESFVVLPNGEFLIFTKEMMAPKVVKVSPSGEAVVVKNLDLPHLAGLGGEGGLITDAALSPDEKNILILTYSDLIEVTLSSLFSDQPMEREKDFRIIKGPNLPQQETVTYISPNSFLVSTESEKGGSAEIVTYQCVNGSKGVFHENR
jgi:hypothetical protein